MYLLPICLEKKNIVFFFSRFFVSLSYESSIFFTSLFKKKKIQMFFTLFLSFIFFSFILDLFVVSVCLPSFHFLLVYHCALNFVPFWVDMSCLFVFMFLLCTNVFFNKVSNFSSFLNLFLFLVFFFFKRVFPPFSFTFLFVFLSLSATFVEEWKSLFSVFSSPKTISQLFVSFFLGGCFFFFSTKSSLSTCFCNFVFLNLSFVFSFVVLHKKKT